MAENKNICKRENFLSEIVLKARNNVLKSEQALNYLKSRKVDIKLIKKFDIGYLDDKIYFYDKSTYDKKLFTYWLYKNNNLRKRIIFPLTNPLGEVLGMQARSIDKKDYNIFLTSEGKFTGAFFGIDKTIKNIFSSETVCITEGIFDCLSSSIVLGNCISSLTSNINKSQINQLKRFAKKFIFLFDPNDEAGIKGRDRVKKYFDDDFKVYNNFNFPYEDLNQFSVLDYTGFIKFLSRIPGEIV